VNRDEAIKELGATVLRRAEAAAGVDTFVAADPILEQVVDAFPHTSIGELVDAMLDGIRDDQERVEVSERELLRRASLSDRIRRLGHGHREPLAFYRLHADKEPAAVGIVASIETDGVRLRGKRPAEIPEDGGYRPGDGTFIPWSGLRKVGRP
jgi:hypothetical protein